MRRIHGHFDLMVILAWALCVHALFVPFLTMYPRTDFDVFVLAGKILCAGGKMYVDFFDHKGPVLFCINAFGWCISSGYLGVWFIELVAFLLGLVVLWGGVRTQCGKSAACFVTLMMTLLKTNAEFYNHPESWAMEFSMIAIGLLLIRENVVNCCVAGILAALVLFIKLTLVGPFVAIGMFLLCSSWKKDYYHLFAFVISALISIFCICFSMMIYDVWGEFLNDYFRFNWLYQNSNSLFVGGFSVKTFLWACCKTLQGMGILIFLPGVYLLWRGLCREWRHLLVSPVVWSWFLWLSWDILMISRCGRFFDYHFLTLKMCIIFSILPAFSRIRILRHPSTLPLLLFPFICGYCSSFPTDIIASVFRGNLSVPQRAALVDEFVEVQKTIPDMPLFVWSNSAAAYLKTNRQNPFPYYYWGPMSVDGFLSNEKIEECMQVFQNERIMIVDGMNPYSLQDTKIFEENIRSHDSLFKKRLREVVSQCYHAVYAGKSGLTVYIHN